MEAYVLDICNRERGSLLQNKTFVPLDGPIFSISNSSHNKSISFVRAAWNTSGTQFVAADYHGSIYIFHLEKNRFSLVTRLKVCSSFITFTSSRVHNILVALTDCTIVSVNSESKDVKNHFRHHTSSVVHISFNRNGSTVLSYCKNQAILWDLDTFNVLRILTLKKDVDIVKVFFLPDKDIIVSAFNDNSVFLWNFKKFNCISQFLCISGDSYLSIKTVSASRDEQLVACAGKASWFLVWSVEGNCKLQTVSLPGTVSSVKQVNFLPNFKDEHILSVLSSDGEVYIYNLKCMEMVFKLNGKSGKIISCANSRNLFQILAISFQGNMELYDLEEVLTVKDIKSTNLGYGKLKSDSKTTRQLVCKKETIKKEATFDIDKRRLLSIIKNYEEFPEKHRTFIWSQLLELPHNVDAFNILHQESLKVEPFAKNYSFMNPGTQATFLRLMSLLVCWHPVLKEIDYFQCVVFPFVKVLHKNTILCFELLITLISNWCHSWFLFCPFPPFNVLCVVENILSHHDKELMAHFIKHKVSSEVYAWYLLKTSFSEVFNKNQWLKLWDNILSNSVSFQLYAVAAFNVVLRDVLLRCKTEKNFKECYTKHSISAAALLQKSYNLQQMSPQNIDPESVVGTFHRIPQGAYPTLFEISQMKIHLETATRKGILDQEIDYLKQREDFLGITSKYLKELQELQLMRRKLLLESIELKDARALEALDKKLKSVQSLIQGNLTDQAVMLNGTLGRDMYSNDKEVFKKQYFKFQDFVKKLRKKNY